MLKKKTNHRQYILKFIHLFLSLCVVKLARHQLLRCYLDQGEAGKARQLLDKVPSDSSSCFSFSRALIEHISWTVLHEPGSSEALRDAELAKGGVCSSLHTYIHTYIHTCINI